MGEIHGLSSSADAGRRSPHPLRSATVKYARMFFSLVGTVCALLLRSHERVERSRDRETADRAHETEHGVFTPSAPEWVFGLPREGESVRERESSRERERELERERRLGGMGAFA